MGHVDRRRRDDGDTLDPNGIRKGERQMSTWSYTGTYATTSNIGAGMYRSVSVTRSGALPKAGTYRITAVICEFSQLRFNLKDTTYEKSIFLNLPLGDAAGWPSDETPIGTFQSTQSTENSWMPVTVACSTTASTYRDVSSIALYRVNSASSQIAPIAGSTVTLTITYEPLYTACTAPTSVTLDTPTPRPYTTAQLSWSGAKAGVGNAIASYEIWHATAANGTYTLLQSGVTGTSETILVSAANGSTYFYKIKAISAQGSGYDSSLSTAYAAMTVYDAPAVPTIALPVSGAVSTRKTVRIKLSVPSAPNGQSMALLRGVDGAASVQIRTVGSSGEVFWDELTLEQGEHQILYLLKDSRGFSQNAFAHVDITVAVPKWKRRIATGTVISNPSVSHQADIAELLAAVNACRAYAGLGAIALMGTLGHFADWKAQMAQLRAGLNGSYQALGLEAPMAAVTQTYPTASVINDLRRYAAGTILIA